MCLKMMDEWYPLKVQDTAANAAKEVGGSDERDVDVLIADTEMMCRMTMSMQLNRLGVEEDAIHEADSMTEAASIVKEREALRTPRPMLVLLGKVEWLAEIMAASTEEHRLFVVCTSVDAERAPSGGSFQATLPVNYKQEHLRNI